MGSSPEASAGHLHQFSDVPGHLGRKKEDLLTTWDQEGSGWFVLKPGMRFPFLARYPHTLAPYLKHSALGSCSKTTCVLGSTRKLNCQFYGHVAHDRAAMAGPRVKLLHVDSPVCWSNSHSMISFQGRTSRASNYVLIVLAEPSWLVSLTQE